MRAKTARTTAGATLLALVPALLLMLGGWLHRWSAEDAFIDYRVVENILLGDGPVLNPGERVEAITNPLWAWLVAGCAGLADLLGAEGPPIEWSAALLGLFLSGLGLVWLSSAAARRWQKDGAAVLLPLGALVYAALPPAWDFVTSGLETSLFVAWLGASVLLLARSGEPGAKAAGLRLAAGVVIGLGPLIRPDLALVAGPLFLAALLGGPGEALPWGQRLRRGGVLTLCCGLIPIGYEIFRMGYYASLVPNTALAKEAGLASWLRGAHYLADLVGSYHLWLPALALCWLGIPPLLVQLRGPERHRAFPALALLLGGLAHGLFIVRAGGDFMHARLLLPATLTLLAAVATVPVQQGRNARLGALLVVAWAGLCAGVLRPSYHADVVGPDWKDCTSAAGLTDERCFFVRSSKHDHPITHRDYRKHIWTQDGYSLRSIAGSWSGLLPTRQPAYEQVVFGTPLDTLPKADWVPGRVAALRCNIGLTGLAAGPDVHLIDCRGLGEPIAARLALSASIRPEEVAGYQEAPIPPGLEALLTHAPGGTTLLTRLREAWTERSRPGHEKELPEVWVVARYGQPDPSGESSTLAAARRSLACGELAQLHEAITEPLDLARFIENLRLSFRLTRLRVPADPDAAAATFCSEARE